ncbi:FAD/NAD(P)-binding protein [Nonomuraea sp. NPDC050643]|uniref:FAD/NAD(P)-binding protein n=1 Tax=Nonomuraea sp. NPDC050643 TaxID=3155660 RepID=UPI0033E9FE52
MAGTIGGGRVVELGKTADRPGPRGAGVAAGAFMSAVVVVRAGAAGTCLVERMCANLPSPGRGCVLDLHVVDPYPPGGGRSWRAGQPEALRADSPAGELGAGGGRCG